MTDRAIAAAACLLVNAAAADVPAAWRDSRPLAIRGARVLTDRPAAGRVVETAVDLSNGGLDPFDTRVFALAAEVAGPGAAFTQPGFFMVPYTRSGDGVALAARGEWRVRFTPSAPGTWTVTLRAQTEPDAVDGWYHRTKTFEPVTIEVAPSDAPGMIRVSPRDSRYFAFDSGKPYFPVGLNVCWAEGHGLTDYDAWFGAMGKAGANWARIWMIYWHLALEGTAAESPDFHGAGVYNMDNAARLDELFRIADAHGVFLQLCLDSFNELHASPGFPAWKSNPYAAERGGPLKKLTDFWTDPEAKRLYRQKLRYLVARWGAQPRLFAWEFWNEVNGTDDYDSARVTGWHEEMARELRALDPYRRLITTSYGDAAGDPAVWKLPEIEYVQAHAYNLTDTAATLSHVVRDLAKYGKPAIVGEFGAEVDEDKWITGGGDAAGLHLATALWAVPLAGAAGTPMIWYWGNYVHRRDLWHHYAAVGSFLAGVDWPGEGFKPVRADLTFASAPPSGRYRAVLIRPDATDWGTKQGAFILGVDGGLTPASGVSQYLYGDGKPEFRSPLVLHGDFRDPCALKLRVLTVSDLATLVVTADGKRVFEKTFKPGPGKGEWRQVVYAKEWNVYQNVYDLEVTARIPAGTKEIGIENAQGDWMIVGTVAIDPGLPAPRPPLDVYGLTGNRTTLVYLKHAELNWVRAMSATPIDPCPPTRVTIGGLASGRYAVTLIDPATGKPVGASAERDATATGLAIDLPAISSAVALKIARR